MSYFPYTAWSTAEEDSVPMAIPSDENAGNLSETSVPAWDSDPTLWDYDVAAALAEKLLLLDPNSVDVKQQSVVGTDLEDCTGDGLSSNPRFKTEFCRNYREKGSCLYGDLCQFAHGRVELRQDVVRHIKYKTKLCQKFWIAGYCAYGPRCNFIHQEENDTAGEFKPEPTVAGFRSFRAQAFIRKTSESSNDSGIDNGFSRTYPTRPETILSKQNHQVSRRIDPKNEINCNYDTLNLNTVPLPKPLVPSQYPETTNGPRTELVQGGFKSRSGYGAELIRTGLGLPSGLRAGPPQRSRFGFELQQSGAAVSVPHPEHNPIPEPIRVALKNLNNRSDSSAWGNCFY